MMIMMMMTIIIIIINLVIDINREIQELEQGKTYLGIEESEGIQHQQMKERLNQE